ncbi:MAG: AraC family transcriptional regulator, partial [Calditrichaeota bacterium]|nr:AraC family transcriptional regulator [Calditrichota bacterium]
ITREMEVNRFFLNPDSGLPELAKLVDSNPNHVSQVINECLQMNYFELIAQYRIELAKSLMKDKETASVTIEEIATSVGYLSKSAFNKAFKKVTGQTPSEYRLSI